MNEEEEKIIRLEYERRKRLEKEKEQENKARSNPPIFNAPPVTKYLTLVLVLIYCAQYFSGEGVNYWLIDHFAMIPAQFTDLNRMGLLTMITPITHSFLHGSWLHLGMNALMLLAFGAGVERMLGVRVFITSYFLGALFGAACQFLLAPFSPIPMIGASGAISALFGVILVVLQKRGALGYNVSIKPFILLWIGLSIFIGIVGIPGEANDVAWAAHLGGFFAGLVYVYRLFRRA